MQLDTVGQAAVQRARAALDILDPPATPLGLSRKEIGKYSLLAGALALARGFETRIPLGTTTAERMESMHSRSPRSFEEECSLATAKALGRELLPGRLLVPLEILTRDMTPSVSAVRTI